MNVPKLGFLCDDDHLNQNKMEPAGRRRKPENQAKTANSCTKRQKVSPKVLLELPQEMLNLIFRHFVEMEIEWKDVGRVARVCKRCFSTITDKQLIKIFLERDELTNLGLTSRLAVKIILRYCPDVRGMRLTMDAESDPKFSHLAALGKSNVLSTLKLSSNFIDDRLWKKAAKQLTGLTSFENNYSGHLTPMSLLELSKHCTRLTKLVWNSHRAIPTNVIIHLSERCGNLRKFSSSMGEISDDDIQWISNHCPSMKSFNVLQSETGITDNGVIQLAQRCTGLRQLHLMSPGIHTNRSLQMLSRYCTNLKSLILDTGTVAANEVGLTELVKGCTRLQTLSLNFGEAVVTDKGAIILAQYNQGLISLTLNNTLISDRGLRELVERCRHLRHLHLDNSLVTDEGVVHLAQNIGGQKASISLNFCQHIRGYGIIRLADYCHKLNYVSLKGCPNIDIPAIKKAVASKFKIYS